MSNDTEREPHRDPARRRPAPDKPSEADAAERSETPDALRKAAITGDKNAAGQDTLAQRQRARGVEWVRPTDLIAQRAGLVARRGIDLEAELVRRARTPVVAGARRVSERARRLPPVTAFGRRGGHDSGPVRSGVGMR